jgi:predicted DNA-binding transcriptional regulator AlpA
MYQLVTIGDVARQAKVCRTTIWRYRRRFPDFPSPVIFQDNTIRFVQSEINEWMLSHKKHD